MPCRADGLGGDPLEIGKTLLAVVGAGRADELARLRSGSTCENLRFPVELGRMLTRRNPGKFSRADCRRLRPPAPAKLATAARAKAILKRAAWTR